MQTSGETVRIGDGGDRGAVAAALLAWYDVNARRLPWRALPGESAPDPYRVWLSEVMLQQTTVAAVRAYYAKFLALWPTVEALAAADDADVMAAWAGLGYYARARNLLACAREVARLGGFPPTEEGLRALPGLGAYTAAAVAAIAFGQRAVVVDANVERVVSRLFAIAEPLPGGRTAIRAATDRITPDGRAGDFAQGLMDLGSSICTVRSPRCLLCPLADACAARAAGTAEAYPVKAAKKAKPTRTGTAFWIEQDGAVLLVRREGKGMLGGMRALPDDGWSARGDGHAVPPVAGDWHKAGVVRHGFTHFDLELQLMLCARADCASLPAGEFWPVEGIEAAGLPTVFAKAARLALAHR
ncbi:A/G-specific adenine glycosylase [Novosphingobium fuchskuhlense]|uniref:Adenine DNA glycosylase n=1 Tax=Novosphingobium fuchskuhlense TaxID=1117702 RepID=A0A117UY22_9SPHN|nr:A/G-specific adenine glycosylase [Novosphingobium fuchskuhlense]KUR72942.1 A/G-specific adenine glycosylase [Novosphingobium fuchskuhlense]